MIQRNYEESNQFVAEDVANKIWLRWVDKNEKVWQYKAFQMYLRLPTSERSIRTVALENGRQQRRFMATAAEFQWLRRAQAYDQFLLDANFEDIEAYRLQLEKEEAAKWEARKQIQREREWALRDKLLEKAEQMLNFQLYQDELEEEEIVETSEDGRTTIIRQTIIKKPVQWRIRDASRMIEVSSKLGRLAAEMATERQEVNIDVTNLSNEELDRIIAGKSTR